jgi:hypothetical protein
MELSVGLSLVERYSHNCVDKDHMLTKPDGGFELKDRMPYGRIDELVFSYDGQHVTELRECNEEPMTDVIAQKADVMEISKYNLYRAYRATGAVTECGPYECNYAHGGNEWLEPPGSQL